MNNAIAARPNFDVAYIDDESIGRLMEWTVRAPVEEVAWNSDNFPKIRDWLKARKAASDLRVKAARVELIALRRVGMEGLDSKLSRNQGIAAKWLAGIEDAEFERMLADIKESDTPEALRRRGIGEHRGVREHIEWMSYASGATPEVDITDGPSRALPTAIATVLDEVSDDGAPFSVQEATARLAVKLREDYGIEIPEELSSEPLRESVRSAIRGVDFTAAKGLVHREEGMVEFTIPRYVTIPVDGFDGFMRVPWKNASVGQLSMMVSLRARQAEQMVARAEALRVLLETVEALSEGGDEKCAALLQRAIDAGEALISDGRVEGTRG